MRLLVDTDIFCKLTVSALLGDSARLLGSTEPECQRLAALPHMLRRGQLRKQYGEAISDSLISHAENMAVIETADSAWLEPLVGLPAIDPGEAQLFAVAARGGLLLATGDKRALRAVRNVPVVATAISGRVAVLEAVLIGLCDALGAEVVRGRVQPLVRFDKVVLSCFSARNANPVEGLLSYYAALSRELAPLKLWNPREGGSE